MSVFGTKQTSVCAASMSALEVKRTKVYGDLNFCHGLSARHGVGFKPDMPDMVSVSVSRAKSMLEGGRVARGHEVFGQQGRPRLWHDRLETQFFRRLVRGLGSSLQLMKSVRRSASVFLPRPSCISASALASKSFLGDGRREMASSAPFFFPLAKAGNPLHGLAV